MSHGFVTFSVVICSLNDSIQYLFICQNITIQIHGLLIIS